MNAKLERGKKYNRGRLVTGVWVLGLIEINVDVNTSKRKNQIGQQSKMTNKNCFVKNNNRTDQQTNRKTIVERLKNCSLP